MSLSVPIKTPCPLNWGDMPAGGGEKVRFCDTCQKQVFNLSAMTEAEARQVVEQPGGKCVMYAPSADGRVLTRPCAPESAQAAFTPAFISVPSGTEGHSALWAWLGVGLGLVGGGVAAAYAQAGGDPCAPLRWAEKIPFGVGTWVSNRLPDLVPMPVQDRCYPRRFIAGGI
jgi:hypothetical protein